MTPPVVALIRKLIAVLESIEKVPVHSYDVPGAGYGLQVNIMMLLTDANDSDIY